MRRLALAAAILGLPAAAAAQIDNSALECGADHTYFPRGDHWAMFPPDSASPVVFHQQKDGARGVPENSELAEVEAAFNTWASVTCPGGGRPNISIEAGSLYDTRDRGDVYQCNGDDCSLISARNIIYFVTSDWESISDEDTVAVTTNLYVPDTGMTVTADMEFNADNLDWRTDSGGCSGSSCFHVETVALHEAGHFFGFNHVQCSDAVMFPQGSGTAVRTNLSAHEIEGVCTIYAPRSRAEQDKPDVMERCTQSSDCLTGLCIKPGGHPDSPFGWCAHPCTTPDNCDTGFVCVQQDGGGQRFCRPGAHDTGGAVTGGNGGSGSVDPVTGEALDLCMACTAGDQCSSGICMSDGSSDGICTRTCVTGTVEGEQIGGCPVGMTCVGTDQDWSVCWPETSTSCGTSEYQAVLNEVCFAASSSGSDYYRPCGPDLICFGFKPRCGGQQGACVQYCNAAGRSCQDGNLSCCFGVDDLGNCLGSTAGEHGGCFDIRLEGESCVTAEQSICESGASCFFFGDPVLSKCYGLCPTVDACRDTETCVSYSDACRNQFSVCCDDDKPWQEECLPGGEDCLSDVGVACRRDEDCDSRQCLIHDGQAACSRWCNPVTGVGCPGNVDVNGDGLTDGGFQCLLAPGVGEGRCWPKRGPADPPACADAGDGTDPPSGCCNATGLGTGDVLLGLLLWVPLVGTRFGRRRLHRRR